MAGGAGTGGAADTDGTVIIDSELGHGARRRLSRPLDLVFRGFCPEVRIPVTKGIFQAFIAHLKHQMCTFLRPLHLLLFGKALTYDLIDRRFDKARRNRLLIAPTFAVIRNERLVHHDVCVELVERFSELLTALAGNATVVQNAVQVFEFVSRSNHIPMPQVVLNAFQ